MTDLRLRRDTSSSAMLRLNLRALVSRLPDLEQAILELTSVGPQEMDGTAARVHGWLTSDRPEAAAAVSADQDPLSAYVSMLKYVNAFGIWEDARGVARQVFDSADRWGDSLPESSARALAAVVLGLCGDEAQSDILFSTALSSMPHPVERVFSGLRWASIQAKRRGRIQAAESLIDALEREAADAGIRHRDRLIASGMLCNFRGLIAIRRKASGAAREIVIAAIGQFESGNALADDGCVIGLEEGRRYEWMAKLNLIQLDIYEGRFAAATRDLRELAEFSRAHDPGSLHTSLSTLAYVHLRAGLPEDALPLLLEAHDLLRSEYDPFVVRQVRKMLRRCYLELGRPRDAEQVEGLPEQFWLTTPLGA
ncbi:hypothetical protein [Leifsonia williamsii]|uniref:hypothetical protein n=1 Tax=Leifsonia williamsii TaxID=3035919 RepID=UPI00263BCDBC|nr:hypothetical protein [Leifsonia williamsii]